MHDFKGKRVADRRATPRPGSHGRRAEDTERQAWATFLDGCRRAWLDGLIAGRVTQ